MNRNDLVWIVAWDTEFNLYLPQRNIRRFTRADNSYTDKVKCQEACDKKNISFEHHTPLELIPDKTVTSKNQ